MVGHVRGNIMSTGINLPAVLVADGMGILLMLSVFGAMYWRLYEKNESNRKIVRILMIVLVSCIADVIADTIEGYPGKVAYVIEYATSWWLFLSNMIMGPAWIDLVKEYTQIKNSKINTTIIGILSMVGIVLLVVNFFTPVVFSLDEQNRYARGPLFVTYLVLEIVFIIDGIIFYWRAKNRGHIKRFFPVWQFVIPISCGILAQFFFYGVSTIWPSMAISITGIALSKQNETVFMDNLTGIYNRFYLDYWKSRINRRRKLSITGMMLDMNGFKTINDKFGHKEGDEALKTSALILKQAVGDDGTVIRYAGDEFVIILETQEQELVEDCVTRIRGLLDDYNRVSGKQYELSCSIGYCPIDIANSTFDEIMNDVDKRMYEDKKKYYMSHDRRN